jgi:hypothetical protein
LLTASLAAEDFGGPPCAAEEKTARFRVTDISYLDFSPDGTEVLAEVPSGLLTLDTASGKPKSLLRVDGTLSRRPLSKDCSCFIAHAKDDESTGVVYSRSTGRRVRSARGCFPTEQWKTFPVPGIVRWLYSDYLLNNDGTRLYTLSADRVACVSLIRRDSEWSTPWPRQGDPCFLSATSDCKTVVVAFRDAVHVYDAGTGERLAARNLDEVPAFAAISADGRTVAIGTDSFGDLPKAVVVFDRRLVKELRRWESPKFPDEHVCSGAASADLSVIATVGASPGLSVSVVQYWYAAEGKVYKLRVPRVFSVIVTPDGRHLLAFGPESAHLFALPAGKKLWGYSIEKAAENPVLTCPVMVQRD